jgi:predicted DNA-binding transcriptional regulator YafY
MSRPKKGRNDQLIRLLSILRDLDRRDGCSLYELADRYGTTLRTIRRDLDALAGAGLPLLDVDEGRRKRWRIAYPDPRRQLGQLLDASHFLGVVAALGAGTAAIRTNATRVALDDLATKLRATLSTEERQRLGAVAAVFQVDDRQLLRRQPPDVLWSLAVALTESRVCAIGYTAAHGRRSQLMALPLRLFASSGLLYLLIHDPDRGVVRTLALHRIASLRVTDARATAPKSVDAERYVNSLFGVAGGDDRVITYRLRFAADVAPYISERSWHPTQTLRRRKDGGVDLRFACQESVEVTAWVASWREHVEVLEPATLRADLGDLGVHLTRRYAPSADGAQAAAVVPLTSSRSRRATASSPIRPASRRP